MCTEAPLAQLLLPATEVPRAGDAAAHAAARALGVALGAAKCRGGHFLRGWEGWLVNRDGDPGGGYWLMMVNG